MRYDPRLLPACLAAAQAAPHVHAADVLAIVEAALATCDQPTADVIRHAPPLAGVPDCDDPAAVDVVPPLAVWDDDNRVFCFVDAAPVVVDGAVLLSCAEGITLSFEPGAHALVAASTADAEAWNRQRAAETVRPWDWADEDERGAA